MRVIRRGKLRRPGYGPMQQGQLLHGFDFSLDGTGYGEPTHRWAGAVPFDAARARADWEAHRDELMEHWLSDPEAWWAAEGWRREEGYRRIQPGGPGTRPAGYWWFDAPEPRQIVAQWTWRGPSPHLGHLVAAPITVDTSDWPGLWRGPERWRHFGRGMRNPVPAVVDWETEREYLARLNLMSPEEVAALPAEDSERALDQTARYRAPTPRATPPRPSNGHPADMRGDPDRC